MTAALQVSFRLDVLLREYAFLRTHDRYRWQRLPVDVAEKLLAVGAAEIVESKPPPRTSQVKP